MLGFNTTFETSRTASKASFVPEGAGHYRLELSTTHATTTQVLQVRATATTSGFVVVTVFEGMLVGDTIPV